jgi:hypothetical protein
MRFFTRLPAPAVLTELVGRPNPMPKWVQIGERYTANRARNAGFEFQWPTVRKQTLNLHLLPTLRGQTANHCSYCDGFPLGKGDESIDHFLPKQHPDHYALVCQWENLYLACSHCQDSKKSIVEPLVLRPDEISYSFRRYFLYDYIDHKIEVNPRATHTDQQRAEATRQFFDFDNRHQQIKRRHAYQRYDGDSDPVLDDYNFRFMFE